MRGNINSVSTEIKVREVPIRVYLHHNCVGATFGNLVNLKHIHEFPQVAPPGSDANIYLIRSSLADCTGRKYSCQDKRLIKRDGK